MYHLCLRNDRGPCVEITGVDVDQMLVWCIASVRDMDDRNSFSLPLAGSCRCGTVAGDEDPIRAFTEFIPAEQFVNVEP